MRSQYLKEKLGGKIAISKKIAIVQETFGLIYNLNLKYSNAHHLFEDSEQFKISELAAFNTPNARATSACLSYVIGDAVYLSGHLIYVGLWNSSL